MILNFKKSILDLSSPKIMGILNITPDSFSDGGKFTTIASALKQAITMQQEGADIIDIGGESTRPYAKKISINEELDRVIPVIQVIKKELNIPISIDTRNAQVMQEAVSSGADLVNDVNALRGKNSLNILSKLQVPVCLMHMNGNPETMQNNPHYQSVTDEVFQFLKNQIKTAIESGIKIENIIIDPGFGFGKSLEHNIELLKNLRQFDKLQCPILVGISRKTMIGQILDLKNPKDRATGSLIANCFAIQNGAKIIRTHDVLVTKQMLMVSNALH